jgi:hypothetical protein
MGWTILGSNHAVINNGRKKNYIQQRGQNDRKTHRELKKNTKIGNIDFIVRREGERIRRTKAKRVNSEGEVNG